LVSIRFATQPALAPPRFTHAPNVKIFVSGGITPERIRQFVAGGAPVDGYGVGSYISGARPIDFTGDLKVVAGKPLAKRGRIPGITHNPRLKKVELSKLEVSHFTFHV